MTIKEAAEADAADADAAIIISRRRWLLLVVANIEFMNENTRLTG